MNYTALPIWCTALTLLLVSFAVVTDLKWRRIPNYLTFTAFGIALVLRAVFEGWVGLGLALGGAFVAPILLLLLHGGKGIGMGDLKLAAAVGAFVGPALAVVTMLISAIAGGVLALFLMIRPGGQLSNLFSLFSISLPFRKKETGDSVPVEFESDKAATMPYGVAIGAGSLITLVVYLWTGQAHWFL